MIDTQPKPCPFCGAAAAVSANDDIIWIGCETVNCPASPISSGDLVFDAHKVLTAWNTRVSHDAHDLVEAAKAVASDLEAELIAKHPGDHPVTLRLLDRDMQAIRDFKAALARFQEARA